MPIGFCLINISVILSDILQFSRCETEQHLESWIKAASHPKQASKP